MKKILFFSLLLTTVAASAQSDKFVKAMQPKVAAIDTTVTVQGLTDLAASFERIALAEKTQWLPYYYAALATVNSGYMQSNGQMDGSLSATIDPLADKADAFLSVAQALTKENSELLVLKKMILSLRMMADPMNRWMKYGAEATKALEMAKKMDPQNPRVYLLEGQDKFYTPEQFGGSKTEAKKLFDEANKKFETHKAESALHPSWGKNTVAYFIAQASK